MRIRADQVHVGDQLQACEVVWVLPTPDHRSIVVGLKSVVPRRGGLTRLTARYKASATVDVARPPQPRARVSTASDPAGPETGDGSFERVALTHRSEVGADRD